MSNIKAFLEAGSYVPPEASLSAASSTSGGAMLHVTRALPSLDAARPTRFIVVDSPEHFKPEYWDRVVAVFTTGQPWQFKTYKWQDPAELFRRVAGVHVGWRGEPVPERVRAWGRGVACLALDPPSATAAARWRDREVVEAVWKVVEETMRRRGWTRDSGPLPQT
jgi:parafibromin